MIHNQARKLRRIERQLGTDNVQHIELLDDYSFIINHDSNYYYKPVPTGLKFHQSNDLVRCIIGPYGSGKTSALLAEIVFRACAMPKMSDGIRRSKWAIIRNTYGELETTTFQSWLTWFGELGQTHRVKKPVLQYFNKFNDADGRVEIELLFLALDKEKDIAKLKSLEITGAYINEASEIPLGVLSHLMGRINRYPKHSELLPPYWAGIMMDSNPPKAEHWIPHLFEAEKPKDHLLLHQPPGLIKDDKANWRPNPEAENIERLGKNYYMNMTLNATEEFIKVYCLGQYGSVLSGKKVYPEYNDDIHSNGNIAIDEDLPVYIGMDFGLTPSAIFIQENKFGQYIVVAELCTEQLGLLQFIENVLNPFVSRYLTNIEIGAIIGDPAGNKRNENDMTSCFDIMHENGFYIEGAATNNPHTRLEAVRKCLIRLINGQPAIIINRECSRLREGFLGGYQYKKLQILGEERYSDKPDKNMYSHIHDALQYVILYLNGIREMPEENLDNLLGPKLGF